MSGELKPPIILFGNTRSGTTIVQKVMSAHPELTVWYEPGALWLYGDPGRPHDEFNEHDATEKVKRYIRKKFLKYQEQYGNFIVLEKTPQNILRIPYVRAIFPEAKFLYIVRNPFSFISSVEFKWQKPVTGKGVIRRLKSTPTSQLHHYVGRFIVQQFHKRLFRHKYLPIWGPRYKGIQEDLKTHDLLTVIARQWSFCSRIAERDFSLFEKGELLRLRYEDFVDDPIKDLERICEFCGLDLTDSLVAAAKDLVKSDRHDKWRRFQALELAQILPEIQVEMQRHGYEAPLEIGLAYHKLQEILE